MKQPKLIIFDMDGLIFDTEKICYQIMKKTLQKHNYKFNKEMYIKTIGSNNQEAKNITMSFMPENFPYDQLIKEVETELENFTNYNSLPIKPGLIPLLNHLKEKNITCCIASSSNNQTIKRYLEKANIISYFDFFIGGNQVEHTKPQPDLFLKALEIAKIKARDSLVIEDSENGILAAKRANIPVICIPDMKIPDKEFRSYSRCIMDSLDKIIEII